MTLIDLKHLALIALVFLPLERVAALWREQKILRPGWKADLAHFLMTGLIIRAGLALSIALIVLASGYFMPREIGAAVRAQSAWLQFAEILVLSDLGFYWAHRACHSVPFLWRFHAVHHSIEHLDWLAVFRVHPVDQIFTKSISFLPIFLIGFSPAPIAAAALLYQWQSVFLHANTRIGFGPLRYLIASPRFHQWHHANCPEALDKNFAGQLSFLDWLFGTQYLPAHGRPQQFGTQTPVPKTYLGQLMSPFAGMIVETRNSRD